MSYFFHARLFQTSFVQWLFCFAQNLQTSVTILIYKNFFGPLGYSALAYVMAGPERYHHLRFGALIFLVEWGNPLWTTNPRLYFKPVVHRNGFESRTARVNLKEDMDEETSAEGKERQRKALQSFAKEFGRGVRQQRTRGKTKERAGTLPLALSMFRRNASAHGEVDLLKEVQGSEGQTTVQDAAEEWDYLFKRRRTCSKAQLQEVYHSFLPCSFF